MANAKADNQQPAETPAKSFNWKPLAVLGAVIVLEAATIIVTFYVAGRPSEVQAQGAVEDLEAQGNMLVELQLVEGRFQNFKQGEGFVYDTTIWVRTKQKHKDKVERIIERNQATLRTEVAEIVRSAEPAHLIEDSMATLSRQIKAKLDDRLGYDEKGEALIERVLVSIIQIDMSF